MSKVNRKKLVEFLGDKKNFPLLILDEVYLRRFPKKSKTGKMKSLERLIKDKMKEEAKHTDNIKRLKVSKSAYLKEILVLSDDIQKNPRNTVSRMRMDETNKKVLSINEKLLESEERLSRIPAEMSELNLELLSETIDVCYKIMNESDSMIKKLDPEIDSLRQNLLDKTAEKATYEDNKSRTYNFLNAMAGRELIDFLDDEMSDEK